MIQTRGSFEALCKSHAYKPRACPLVHFPIPLAALHNPPATAHHTPLATIPPLLFRASTGRVPDKSLGPSLTVVWIEHSSKPALPVRRSSALRTIKDLVSAMPSYLRSNMNSRSYSFPPCIDSLDFSAPAERPLPDIDEEPFAHFLTPVCEEDDPYDALSLSAGIVVPDGPRSTKASKFRSNVADKWARYVKSNHSQLHGRYHGRPLDAYDEDEEESFMQLEDDRLNDTPHMVAQLTSSPPRITVTEPTRGRAQELLSRKARSRRRYSRTLSGHRHSWREPSPELFTVDESEEDEMPVLRRSKSKKTKDGVERRRSSRSRARGEVAEKSWL